MSNILEILENHAELLTVLAIFVLVLGMLYFIFLYHRKNKGSFSPNQKETSKPAVPEDPLIPFIDYMKDTTIRIYRHGKKVQGIFDDFEETKGNKFDGEGMLKLMRAGGLLDVKEMLIEYRSLLEKEAAPKITKILVDQYARLQSAADGLREALLKMPKAYKKGYSAFSENIMEISKVHDEMTHYRKGKKLKPEAEEYIKKYAEIFQNWGSAGADKSAKSMRNQIVIKVLALNKMYPGVPYVARTDEPALKCEGAYEEINEVDKAFEKKHEQYQTVLKSAVLMLRRIVDGVERNKDSDEENADTVTAPKAKPGASAIAVSANQPSVGNGKQANSKEAAGQKPVIKPGELPMPDKGKSGTRKGWTPAKWAMVIVGLILGLAAIALGSDYALKKIRSEASVGSDTTEKRINVAGHTIPALWGGQKTQSHKEHYQILKPKLDSIYHEIGIARLMDSLQSKFGENTRLRVLHKAPDSLHLEQIQIDEKGRAKIDTQKHLIPRLNDSKPHYGIDVSVYQKRIQWDSLVKHTDGPEKVRFAIMRATHGLKVDENYHQNWMMANKHLEFVGAYHYFFHNTDPKEQATFFLENTNLKAGNIRPVIDVEACDTCIVPGSREHTLLIENVKIYLDEIEKGCGCKPIIYTYESFYRKLLEGKFPDHDFWMAHYDSIPKIIKNHATPKDKERVLMWQYSSKGRIPGIPGNVDLDYLPGKDLESVLLK